MGLLTENAMAIINMLEEQPMRAQENKERAMLNADDARRSIGRLEEELRIALKDNAELRDRNRDRNSITWRSNYETTKAELIGTRKRIAELTARAISAETGIRNIKASLAETEDERGLARADVVGDWQASVSHANEQREKAEERFSEMHEKHAGVVAQLERAERQTRDSDQEVLDMTKERDHAISERDKARKGGVDRVTLEDALERLLRYLHSSSAEYPTHGIKYKECLVTITQLNSYCLTRVGREDPSASK